MKKRIFREKMGNVQEEKENMKMILLQLLDEKVRFLRFLHPHFFKNGEGPEL